MKTIHSDDLSRVSMQKGASITTGGRQINASRHRDNTVHALPERPKLAPVPPPAPVEPPKPDALLAVAKSMQANQQGQEQIVALVAQLVREVRDQRAVPAAPIKSWEFEVEYDESYPVKRMQRIRAFAIR